MLRDERWEKARILTDAHADSAGLLAEQVFLGSLVFKNPPDHTRLRRIVSPLFTAPVVARRRERTREIATDVIAAARELPNFDFRESVASEIPVRLICDLIGVPRDDRATFLDWANTVRELQELGERTVDDLRHADDKAQACLDFFARLAAKKRRSPGEDLLSQLISAADADAEPLTHEELTAMLIILHVGGHSTTTDVISTAVYRLLTMPELYATLARDRALVQAAVEEMIRIDPPVTVATPRSSASDVELEGVVIPAGEVAYAVLAAANRDPAQFAQPSVLDVNRADNKHLSFAVGPHFCLGAHLGRQEAQEALTVLLGGDGRLALAVPVDELRWQDSLPHRGLEALPVAWAS
jgi:cytochrome P450